MHRRQLFRGAAVFGVVSPCSAQRILVTSVRNFTGAPSTLARESNNIGARTAEHAPNNRSLRRKLQPLPRQRGAPTSFRHSPSRRNAGPTRSIRANAFPGNRSRSGHALDASRRCARPRLERSRRLGPHRSASAGLEFTRLDSSRSWHSLASCPDLRLGRPQSLSLELCRLRRRHLLPAFAIPQKLTTHPSVLPSL
jgi:hypothetical protein